MSVGLLALGWAAVRIAVPYVLAAMGGTVSERAGVVALGLEGMLLGGAFTATLAADAAGTPWAGVVGGAAGGALVALAYGLSVVRGRADGIVAGVALNLVVLGLTRFLLQFTYHSASSSPPVPGLDGMGPQGLFVGATLVVVVALHAVLGGTALGLRWRAVGEAPAAAASLGVDPARVRLGAVLLSGVLAGLGGAWMALDNHGFVDRMSGGRGYIALAAVISGRWRPLPVALATLAFAGAEAMQLQLQAVAGSELRELVQVLPYGLTLVALAGVLGRARPPAGLGRPL